MITVAGFNTSIDKLVDLDALTVGEVNRARAVRAMPGGKGLHVAQTIAALGEDVQLVGLIDTANRPQVEAVMRERGVIFHGIEVPSIRSCLAIRDADGRMTELLEPGPQLDAATRDALIETFRALAAQSDYAVMSGSLPAGCESNTYARLTRELLINGVPSLVDASGDALRHAIEAQPLLVKPNRDEASAWLAEPVDDLATAARALHALSLAGVQQPLLSLGARGALALDTDGSVWHAHVAIDHAVNAVGSGDCLLAGMTVALARKQSLPEALRLAVACGAANAASDESGYITLVAVDALLPRVELSKLA